MTKEQIRAKSMELALKFLELTNELPITLDLAIDEGHGDEEFDRAFKNAVALSKKFENFILKGDPV